MSIWSAEIKELERLYESFKGQLPDLEKELGRLIKADDENMILLYSRRCLEVIIIELCECELKRERGTEPLKGIIDKLHKERKVPDHISTSMHGLNDLSTYGAHPKDFDPEQVKPVLNNLDIIIKWYLKYKETGLETKAKPDEEIKHEIKSYDNFQKSIQIPKNRFIRLVSGLILLIAIVVTVLFVTGVIGDGKSSKEPEKSIAVLPFFNDSPDSENASYINGLMAEILNNLSKIKELSVRPRTSVEKYRNPERPPAPQIGKELNVSYLVDGRGQKYGNIILLTVELIDAAKDIQIWTDSYKRDLKDAGDFFAIQSQVAKAIATELKTIITPEEKELIEKTPTTSLTAYDFFQKGRDEHVKFWIDNENREALENAEEFYNKALEYDSAFAKAYTGLARVYWDKNFFKDYLSKNFQDSTVILCDHALTFDHQLSDAYTLKGFYYSENGKSDQAIEEFDKAIKFNPNDWMAYLGKSRIYLRMDFVNNIKNLKKAISINRGPELPNLLEELGGVYFGDAGFTEKAKQYYQDKLKLDGDSAAYYNLLAWDEFWRTDFNKSIELGLKVYAIDSTNDQTLQLLGINYAWLGRYKESLKYYNKWLERLKTHGELSLYSPFSSNLFNNMHRIGYSYWQNGHKKEAEYYFNEQINYCNKIIDLKRLYAQTLYPYYDLAGVYAFRGDKIKAYANLRIFNQRKTESLWMVMLIKTDPLFNSIRNEPEFQQIARDVEAKYQAGHERLRK
jgi:TolB-like protein/Tfp pilus assembly protein PilF